MKKQEGETQLKLKDIKGAKLSGKDKKALDPGSEKATVGERVKAGAGLIADKIKEKFGKAEEKVSYSKHGQWSLKKSIDERVDTESL